MIDPISALLKADYPFSAMICENLLDTAKLRGITVVCTSLMDQASSNTELSASQVSTIADTWLHVSYVARDGERNRALTIIKSRGTGHSNQVRELILDASGIDLVDVYVAEGEVLMGSARAQKEAEAERLHVLDEIAAERLRLNLERELSEARARVQAATLELGWKQREADMIKVAEKSRLEVGRVAAIERLDLRRAKDDTTADDVDGAPRRLARWISGSARHPTGCRRECPAAPLYRAIDAQLDPRAAELVCCSGRPRGKLRPARPRGDRRLLAAQACHHGRCRGDADADRPCGRKADCPAGRSGRPASGPARPPGFDAAHSMNSGWV